jgi:glutathione reductase (NADPH)
LSVGSADLEFKRRAAKYGKKVAVVEVTAYLGGTCVNVGMFIFFNSVV